MWDVTVFLPCSEVWVCALQSFWAVVYMRPPALSRGGKGKSYLHPVKLFLMVSKFHQMAFLNRLQSEADHRTSQTEAKAAFTNPKIKLRTNFTQVLTQLISTHSATKSPWMLSYTISCSSNNTEIGTKTKLWSRVCVVKIINDPDWGWFWSLSGLTVETLQCISCNFTQGLILTKNTGKKTGSFSGRAGPQS